MRARVIIEQAEERHLWAFGLHLTPADDEAAKRAGWLSAFDEYATLFEQSVECWAGRREGQVICLLGVRRRPLGGGLWFHSGAAFIEHGRAFLRPARELFNGLRQRWPELQATVDPLNPAMVRLATFVGFELDPPRPVGDLALIRHPAVLRRQPCAAETTAQQP